MRILITGAFGFVGSWLTSHLACQGHEVFAMSRTPREIDFGCDYTLLVGDVTESPERLAEGLPDNLDLCLHTASFNEYFAPGYAKTALEINGLGTRNVLEALRLKTNARNETLGLMENAYLPGFIYFSTFHVYGMSQGLVSEEDPPAPRNDYALTHLIGEEYCRCYARTHGMPTLVMRLSNGYGAPKVQPFGKWYLILHDLCREAVNKGTVTLRSDPETKRDFVWLGDVAMVMEKLGGILPQRLDLYGQALNLASGRGISIGEMTSKVAAVYEQFSGKKAVVNLPDSGSAPTAGTGAGPGSSAGTPHGRMTGQLSSDLIIDNLRLKTLLGPDFEFTQNFEKEIWDTFEFIKEHGAEA